MIGSQLENSGWKQGAIVNKSNNSKLLKDFNQYPDTDNVLLIVASQSCDVANNKIEDDPFVEFSIARIISDEDVDEEKRHNKHPRILHTTLCAYTEDTNIIEEINIEVKAFEKIQIHKEVLVSLIPNDGVKFRSASLSAYVAWLSARYSRPALPSAFNDRIRLADQKKKLRKKAKKNNDSLYGIYVEIMPDEELSDGEVYKVNLLGLVPVTSKDKLEEIKSSLDEYANVMRKADMEVTVRASSEDAVPVSTLKRFKRFYYDDLSFREEMAPLPPEITTF